MRSEAPARAVLELEGFTWHPAGPADAPSLAELVMVGNHAQMYGLPASSEDLLGTFSGPRFRHAMVCLKDGVAVGAAATSHRSRRNLNLHLMCMFREPERAVTPLAVYVRHLFWLMPLHRVYAQVPMVALADAYVKLLQAVGFSHEGTVRDHALIEDRTYDVAVFGMLRREFEAWCEKNLISLAL